MSAADAGAVLYACHGDTVIKACAQERKWCKTEQECNPVLLSFCPYQQKAIYVLTEKHSALVAQWIEHQTSNLMVAGSNPAGGTDVMSQEIGDC